MKPKLLDLFCGAGGATRGYQLAGFEVRGVDNRPQPRYVGEEFIQADALDYLARLIDSGEVARFAAIHASPPCQMYSKNMRHLSAGGAPLLIEECRMLLKRASAAVGLNPRFPPNAALWIIENVDGAPLAVSSDLFGAHGVLLCGRMFGLELYRHRKFETSFPVPQLSHSSHAIRASRAGHWEAGTIVSVCGNCAPIKLSRAAMGIDWTTRDELAQAIPPAYTEFIGSQLMEAIR
jgi:DNA (cytosine-5)-methyltransferase 1